MPPSLCLLQKRCKFTEQAVEAVGLSNVRVHWGRAEDAGGWPSPSRRTLMLPCVLRTRLVTN